MILPQLFPDHSQSPPSLILSLSAVSPVIQDPVGNFHVIWTCPLHMLISSATLRRALQVIVINQPASDQALPSTAASSQPALLSLNGAVFPHSYDLAALGYVSG